LQGRKRRRRYKKKPYRGRPVQREGSSRFSGNPTGKKEKTREREEAVQEITGDLGEARREAYERTQDDGEDLRFHPF